MCKSLPTKSAKKQFLFKKRPVRKIRNLGNLGKLGNKKTRNNFCEISEVLDLFEISICHFFILQKNIFQYSKVQKQPFADAIENRCS